MQINVRLQDSPILIKDFGRVQAPSQPYCLAVVESEASTES